METKNIETLLETEIKEDLENMGDLELGSEEHKQAFDILAKLLDRAIDLKKVEVDAEEKAMKRESDERTQAAKLEMEEKMQTAKLEMEEKLQSAKLEMEEKMQQEKLKLEIEELELKKQQHNIEKKDQRFRNGIAIAGIVIPSVLTVWGTFKTLKFEETGTVTTMMGRGFINKLLPKK